VLYQITILDDATPQKSLKGTHIDQKLELRVSRNVNDWESSVNYTPFITTRHKTFFEAGDELTFKDEIN